MFDHKATTMVTIVLDLWASDKFAWKVWHFHAAVFQTALSLREAIYIIPKDIIAHPLDWCVPISTNWHTVGIYMCHKALLFQNCLAVQFLSKGQLNFPLHLLFKCLSTNFTKENVLKQWQIFPHSLFHFIHNCTMWSNLQVCVSQIHRYEICLILRDHHLY